MTKKTHYIPCFWAALWNLSYYQATKSGVKNSPSARGQKVYRLNIFEDAVRITTAGNVFYEKHLGRARIDSGHLTEGEDLVLDFENVFEKLDASAPYAQLVSVARSQKINTPTIKGEIAVFLTLQKLRGHVMINSLIDFQERVGKTKLDYFIEVRHILENGEIMRQVAEQIVQGDWTVYLTDDPFPLIDAPVTNLNGEFICTLSPYMILKVDIKQPTNQTRYCTNLSREDRELITRRLISNTYREAIFCTKHQAEKWRSMADWRKRRKLILDKPEHNRIVQSFGPNDVWEISALANRLE